MPQTHRPDRTTAMPMSDNELVARVVAALPAGATLIDLLTVSEPMTHGMPIQHRLDIRDMVRSETGI